ncbi:MAG: hypothetical protein CO140_03985 [Candidatus Moranbacteria bacterium CG_4_9_14_3_um_filter_40_7]|nr:MAG: hypothetical protein COX31_01355 [Candidatus Moranbacteria bacterium CG23_combo_of_CG06-09_8_20_14_all_40_16]PIU80678.1 MAG: hypothetical protein COS71_02145 [Candidatus Moranbacteria bacterium CG06_land_8_20_14_3_00_40_12]PJA87502.1 MAG: hypothetical protein CO140_03985 [Candidatus Moranbacteria bacterium CG_4_9_14_3_um_filter_40_7]
MNQKLSQIFKNIAEIEPTAGLEVLIAQKIGFQKERALKRKLIFSYAGLAGSGLAAFGAVFSFGGTILQSEFWNLATLLFSDWLVVMGNWQDFLYSLLETFPVVSAIAILIPIFTLFLSLNAYLNNRGSNLKLRFN